MKKLFRVAMVLVAVTPLLISNAVADTKMSRNARLCSNVFSGTAARNAQILSTSSTIAGLVLGSVNGIVLTATTGNMSVIPSEAAKWIPLFNEIANVTSTASGKKWIYSGNTKLAIDGIALGGITGQALSVGADQGALSGALTFGVSVGLTYWFPNKFFHPIMVGIPERLPKQMRQIAKSPIGQGAIGISMIVILEKVLEHAQHLVQAVPHLLSESEGPRRMIAGVSAVQSVSMPHALTLFFLNSTLPDTLQGELRERTLLHLSGVSQEGSLFNSSTRVAAPLERLDRVASARLLNVVRSEVFRQILTAEEQEGLLNRALNL
jgi:hypothetical protein